MKLAKFVLPIALLTTAVGFSEVTSVQLAQAQNATETTAPMLRKGGKDPKPEQFRLSELKPSKFDSASIGTPTLPMKLGKRRVSINDLKRFDGKELYFALVPDGSARGHLELFTDFNKFKSHIVSTERSQKSFHDVKPPAQKQPKGLGVGTLYEHINYGGLRFTIGSGVAIPNLTQYRLSCTLFWCSSWNDVASAAWNNSTAGMLLFTDINYSGPTLYLPSGFYTSNLGWYGWNDRVSSFWVYW